MVTTTTIFVALYWLSFLLYASRYSSVMQDINKDFKLLKVKGVDEESVKSRIENRQFKIGKMKKIIWPLNIVIFLVHIITLSVSAKSESIHFIGALILLVVNILLVIAITWMKGAGTIDSNPRLPGQTRI